ncbi:hybrid sensor histidine kinase/response regulator [Hydrococcus rivularis NIES-593]|uniref:Circadian input-output histidine kinase CikA n=1 Tax=Hydrococcus rivularis NIES-593 TaxID=1921803 RepID=A0A1U7H7I0_9CYAN|nr:ATP-binding protein [Hydrococcus rivularis]OKH18386.1 hybrid sensor histidine kinase/response regulator [Hydrococcus rivularis NIES-593]
MEDILKILVVDDDRVDRLAVRRSLQKAGIRVELSEASDARNAIALLQNTHFDCIFLDYLLPDRDGLGLIQELYSMGVKVPTIVLTGQGDEQIAVEMMKAGASDYLSKTRVSPETLAQTLRNAIRIDRAQKAAELANQRLKASNELLQHQNQELEKQRQQIQLQNLQLQEAYRLKSQFLATMSHELRTPLNAIMGFSQILLRQYPDPLTPQQTEIVQRIINNSQNLLILLNEVLDFSKLESGQLTLEPEEFNLAILVQITVEELRSLALQKQLSLQVDLNLKNPLVVNDQNSLRRILINLLSNAIKFTDSGSIWVKVWELNPDRVAIAVRDTGIGIASEHLETIFEAFRQVDGSLARQHEGSGLGLAITNSLVKMMQGTIAVESQVGKGSAFQVELPRQIDRN